MAPTRILPAETIEIEILPRLPVKSLFRLKSVCKSWNSLISSDVFIKSFRNSDRDSLILISERHYESVNYFTMIIGCVNGLVFTEDSHVKLGTLGFTVQNPATKQCLEIAPPPNQSKYGDYFSGFGFDSVSNDYKLMHVTNTDEGFLVGYIYSCKAGYWSKITQSNFVVPDNYIDNIGDPVLVNGSPFWMITEYYDVNKTRLIVMLFDVRQELFRLLPDLGSRGSITNKRPREFYQLLNFRDSVAVMFYSASELWFGNTIDIHIFDKKCNDWTKTSFGPFKVLSKVQTSCMMPRFRHCLNNGDILFVGSEGKELFRVNLQNYTIKSLGTESGNLCTGYSYSESLVFIKGMKPFYEKEDRFQYFFLKHGAAKEETLMNKYVKEKRKRERRSKRRPRKRQRICKRRNAN